jgi:hypothetical protein
MKSISSRIHSPHSRFLQVAFYGAVAFSLLGFVGTREAWAKPDWGLMCGDVNTDDAHNLYVPLSLWWIGTHTLNQSDTLYMTCDCYDSTDREFSPYPTHSELPLSSNNLVGNPDTSRSINVNGTVTGDTIWISGSGDYFGHNCAPITRGSTAPAPAPAPAQCYYYRDRRGRCYYYSAPAYAPAPATNGCRNGSSGGDFSITYEHPVPDTIVNGNIKVRLSVASSIPAASTQVVNVHLVYRLFAVDPLSLAVKALLITPAPTNGSDAYAIRGNMQTLNSAQLSQEDFPSFNVSGAASTDQVLLVAFASTHKSAQQLYIWLR